MWIRDYFQLDIDLVGLYQQWGTLDPVFRRFQDRFEGIRMLRQDPFENLISYVWLFENVYLVMLIGMEVSSAPLITTYPA